ncbi:hypothetical protein VSH64_21185 [Amycolatopsis rhabdoformis]|uniref:SMI1/KNR4 family protein n=1 Tax=Amycolatopsis rhabdoformis TaxID=1448059 RepID=A0ABZ1IJW9_9PSEU|nr:hypothetical protein [Amycolatopsis rhabdoformis]WSE34567.1 hypothetical protein VSH64_21185 [Amycolatopsis rhabdoformis]
MDDIASAMDAFRHFTEPRDGVGNNPFRLACSFDPPLGQAEIKSAWPSSSIPDELVRAWSTSGSSVLFEDVDYGQWGLKLLSPQDAARRTLQESTQRPAVYRGDDVVIGEFLGDQDLVVFAPSEVGCRRVLVALPTDGRSDWYAVAGSLAEFLDRYLHELGDKYWEDAGQAWSSRL